jgi:hypothetical protein
MKPKQIPTCKAHKIPKEWKPATFEYEENGIFVRIPNIYAWVCPEENSDPSFTPETFDELILMVRDLIDSAKRAKSGRKVYTEYNVTIA